MAYVFCNTCGHPGEAGSEPGYVHNPDDAMLTPSGELLMADERVTRHLDAAAVGRLLDPTAYTGLCAEMAREGAVRAREAAKSCAVAPPP